MKVCLVSSAFPPDFWGGVEHYVERLYLGLKERGHQVKVLTEFSKTVSSNPDVVQIAVPPSEAWSYWSWIRQARTYLARNDFDVVHGNELKGHLTCLASRYSRFVLTPHSWLTPRDSFDSFWHTIGWSLKYAALYRASKILAPTNVVRKSILSTLTLLDSTKVITVPPGGVDLDLFTPTVSPDLVRSSFNLSSDFVIMYYGKVRPDKGIEDILVAARKVMSASSDVCIVVAGGPKGAPGKYYRHLCKTQNDVLFTGFIPLIEAPQFLKSADIFSVYTPPGTPETFCQSLVQAMACGAPVVCSDIPVFREVTKGAALLVPPQRPDLLAGAFLRLKNDPGLCNQLGKTARKVVEEHYSWKAVIDRVERVYGETLRK